MYLSSTPPIPAATTLVQAWSLSIGTVAAISSWQVSWLLQHFLSNLVYSAAQVISLILNVSAPLSKLQRLPLPAPFSNIWPNLPCWFCCQDSSHPTKKKKKKSLIIPWIGFQSGCLFSLGFLSAFPFRPLKLHKASFILTILTSLISSITSPTPHLAFVCKFLKSGNHTFFCYWLKCFHTQVQLINPTTYFPMGPATHWTCLRQKPTLALAYLNSALFTKPSLLVKCPSQVSIPFLDPMDVSRHLKQA